MAITLGAKWTGSFTWGAGQQAQSRWIIADNYAAKTLKAVDGATLYFPSMSDLILSDQADFLCAGLWIKTRKTVHTDDIDFNSGDAGHRHLYVYGGPDFEHFDGLNYFGAGASCVYISAGNYGAFQLAALGDGLVIWNNANTSGHTSIGQAVVSLHSAGGTYGGHGFSAPFQAFGAHLKLKPRTAQAALTGTNTFTIEMRYFYWR